MAGRINSRAKGKAGELELAAFLRDRGYPNARRGVQYAGGSDSPDVTGLGGFHLEVKRTERTDIYGWLEQATNDAGGKKVPVVVYRKNKRKWVAILDLDAFLGLLVTIGM